MAGILTGCASLPPASRRSHLGPVTGLRTTSADVASCSQAGVAWSRAGPVTPAPFRPFALAQVTGTNHLVVAGGTPARSGDVALLAHTGVLAHRKVADDLLYAVAVAPDTGRIAAAGADGRVHLLVGPQLERERTFADHTAPCRAVAFAAGGTLLVSAGLDGVVVVRELAGARTLRLVDHTAPVECLALSGDRIASGARDGKVRVHTRDGRLHRTFGRLGSEVLALCWRDQRTLLAGLADGRVLALHDEGEGARVEVAQAGDAVFAVLVHEGQAVIGTQGRLLTAPLGARVRP